MSEITNAQPVWGPPEFPLDGRLELSRKQLEANYLLRQKEQITFNIENNQRHNVNLGPSCSKTLHISFFFDGTNNNKKNDLDIASPPHPTNISRLFEATYSDDKKPKIKMREYFKYYMPGVGTAFPEIGEYNYSSSGLTYATGGENRINWALLMLINTLYLSAGKEQIPNGTLKKSLEKMATTWPLDGKSGRKQVIANLLETEKIDALLSQKPKALAIKLYVYGFSRGAAEARAFIHWVSQLFDLDTEKNALLPQQTLANVPLSIEFLGILDTVPSVGIVHLVPAFTGHFDWANDTQQLPDEKRYPEFVRCCRHFVAAHEQRLCFPLDTVRRPQVKEGFSKGHRAYPPHTLEVVYPGMHSDVGGGYPQNDQGKAREGDDYLLSQIVLHDMYAEAFKAGAPLCTATTEALPLQIDNTPQVPPMEPKTAQLFKINPVLVARFNAWRTITLKLGNTGNPPIEYTAEKLGSHLEQIIENQMAWMTAWRIDRYAKGRYLGLPFYQSSEEWPIESDSSVKNIKDEKAKNSTEQKHKIDLQKKAKAMGKEGFSSPVTDDRGNIITHEVIDVETNEKRLEPVDFGFDNLTGPPLFESKRDKTQISEAATEFKHDYDGKIRQHTGTFDFPIDTLFKYTMYLLNSDDERLEYDRMKKSGDSIYDSGHGFPVKTSPDLLLVSALFDDQIHDSRAWFMHFELGTREPWAGYFRYRMIYSGNETNKSLSPIALAGQLIGVATLVGGVIYTVRQKDVKGVLGGVSGTVGLLSLEYEVVDIATGLSIPFIDNASELFQPTQDTSDVFKITQAQTAYNYSRGIIDVLSQSVEPNKLLKVGSL
ncbi:DUF2235 domain-containing protein [Providencia rettgeri]|uniref:T6SS phospholipase effector Tle1-like catalytic domain-containing protein n=1 Tax=Providencia TaxID=586 RepID=UPI000E3E57DE|nr:MULTISPECIES: DUF2235 domain-containing protein [Providencia]MCL0000384.1 DUF2235 domain-containing protein [Providencia rettgeri]MCL0002660.1 DUF2235 domain-containing protein [Providencia rettgeri]RFT10963.1 DUF2235 domain-containing protein [Providencia rettgeri]HEP0306858.1 DUF2235 domain-containing protein [Providencia rettgeri]